MKLSFATWVLLATQLVVIAAWNEFKPETPKSNILLVTMGGTSSHKVPFYALADGLIARGHNVTFLSGFPTKVVRPGLTEIAPANLFKFITEHAAVNNLLASRLKNEIPVGIWEGLRYPLGSCEALLSDPEGKKLLNRTFDLIIMDGAYPDCSYAFVHVSKAPYMFVNTVGFYLHNVAKAGSPGPFSITPNIIAGHTDTMSFFQRVHNLVYSAGCKVILNIMEHLVHRIVKSHVGQDIPPSSEFAKNVSFTLQIGHYSVSLLRPFLPSVAEIGCIHCRPARPLPKHLEEFVNGGPGFVFVSMGTSVRTETMPPALLRSLIDAFAQIAPTRVLWKFQTNLNMELPSNVKIEQWLPQQDILGHKKIRAFITHAGLLSMLETAYHGVNVVMMPVFFDHDVNAAKAAADGYGIKIELSDLTTEKLVTAINMLIDEPKYKAVAKRVQLIMQDEQMTPLETGLFWVEYVIRHKGAYHLASPARNLTWYQYYMYDVMLACVALVLALISIYHRLKVHLRRKDQEAMKKKVK